MIEDFKKEMNNILKEFEEKLKNIRGHRLTRDFLENLEIGIYHAKYPLKSLGLISQLDHLTFRFEPFDTNSLNEIEISLKNRGNLSLAKEKNSLIIKFPPLTEEAKKELLKSLSLLKEEIRIKARKLRDEFLKELKIKKEKGEISEDIFYKNKDLVDKEIENFNQRVESLFSSKEKEIL